MIIDTRSSAHPRVKALTKQLMPGGRFGGTKVFVNGKEIARVYHVNTEVKPHVVQSYDALGDDKMHTVQEFSQAERAAWPRYVGVLDSGMLSRTHRGKVTFAVPTKALKHGRERN